jgi:hypothetical protein
MQLDDAEEAQSLRQLKLIERIPVEAMASLRSQAKQEEQPIRNSYDGATLLRHGIAGWSADEPCTLENIALLDKQTADWAIDVILEMNVRPLANAGESASSSLPENSHTRSPLPTGSISSE